MADYMSYMSKYDDFIKKFDQWGGEDLNDAEFAYYMEVQTRAYERLAEKVIEDGKIKPFKIKSVLKGQGILLTSNNSDKIAEQVYPIFWGCKDIENMSSSMDDASNYIKSSLIVMNIKNDDEIMDVAEEFFSNAEYRNTRYSLVAMKRMLDEKIHLQLKYYSSKPGRMELISKQARMVDVYVTKKSTSQILVDVRQASTTEMKEINKLLISSCNLDDGISVTHLSLDSLTTENRISFFDEFNKEQFKDWRFVTVTKVELKRAETSEDEIDEEDESNDEETLANLRGITSAILNGTSIRNNAFVQECLQNDFYISTMGYRYENIKEKIEVVMEINFKYDDLKVDICRTYEFDTDIVEMRQHPLMLNRQEKILEMFQKAAYKHYYALLDKQKKQILESHIG